MIRGDKIKGLSLIHKLPPAYVEDQSANGTFLNGERLSKGELVPLKDGDRLSLILSLSPMLERSFVFHMGAPQVLDYVVPKPHTDKLEGQVNAITDALNSRTITSSNMMSQPEAFCR